MADTVDSGAGREADQGDIHERRSRTSSISTSLCPHAQAEFHLRVARVEGGQAGRQLDGGERGDLADGEGAAHLAGDGGDVFAQVAQRILGTRRAWVRASSCGVTRTWRGRR